MSTMRWTNPAGVTFTARDPETKRVLWLAAMYAASPSTTEEGERPWCMDCDGDGVVRVKIGRFWEERPCPSCRPGEDGLDR
jgi:hypothetical protein